MACTTESTQARAPPMRASRESGGRAGGDLMRDVYDQRSAASTSRRGFNTAADVEDGKTILDVTRTARPDDAVFGEESEQPGVAGVGRL